VYLATGMAQHVGVGREGQGGGLATCLQGQIDRRAMLRPALLADLLVILFDGGLNTPAKRVREARHAVYEGPKTVAGPCQHGE
jgi:hypothetical protein